MGFGKAVRQALKPPRKAEKLMPITWKQISELISVGKSLKEIDLTGCFIKKPIAPNTRNPSIMRLFNMFGMGASNFTDLDDEKPKEDPGKALLLPTMIDNFTIQQITFRTY